MLELSKSSRIVSTVSGALNSRCDSILLQRNSNPSINVEFVAFEEPIYSPANALLTLQSAKD